MTETLRQKTGRVIIDTLDNTNKALVDDPNALLATRVSRDSGIANPSRAYLTLLMEILTLQHLIDD